jgi:hypothetical protein
VTAISFAVRPADAISEQAIFDSVAWVRGVVQVVRLAADSSLPELRRMGTAVVDPAADPQVVAANIRALDGVEYAEVSAERGLL